MKIEVKEALFCWSKLEKEAESARLREVEEKKRGREKSLWIIKSQTKSYEKIHHEVTRHCLPDFPDVSSLSDLLLQPTVSILEFESEGFCLDLCSVVSQPLCLTWRFPKRPMFKFCGFCLYKT
ncbi:hypothetical protein LOK49_LG01G01088 [Camellia lanceoleosa]|uniref:Uncharacterized protein n=1 Tax=Camellia lanceoleosa TaxID=1840588 RepID=A0ACC0J526_9ERIC|nr:hypothetical protein LOK49_LG01G01088 [Camellia lanceoleosa]